VTDSSNVELVRSIFADWERGDFGSAEWARPEIEFVYADGPSPGRWTGLGGMAEATREWVGVWSGYQAEAQEYRQLDEERVLVLTHHRGRAKTSGVELAQMRTQGAGVFHIRDGKVARVVFYFDRERAFADLGLAPEGDSKRS
jgi:ketosteroid isomerase-like protein